VKILEAPVSVAGLLGLKTPDNLRKVQSLSQLTGNKDVLAHDFAAMSPGGQHSVQSSRGLEGRFRGKLFASQTLNLFNE
jgi:hypothetical protein